MQTLTKRYRTFDFFSSFLFTRYMENIHEKWLYILHGSWVNIHVIMIAYFILYLHRFLNLRSCENDFFHLLLLHRLWVNIHGQAWFSCSLYSFHSKQAEQKSSVLEHVRQRTPKYSVFQGGVDRTVTWPVPKQDGGALRARVEIFVALDLFWSTPKCPVFLVLGGFSSVRRVL